MLVPHLVKGAVLSPFKRPGPDRPLPDARATAPGTRIDRGRLAAYARVCGFEAPGDSAPDGAAGSGVVRAGLVPVTYPHVLGFPLVMRLMAGRRFPLPVLGLVHTGIEIRQHRDLRTDGSYELTVYAAGLTPHRRGTEARMVTEVREAGALVWESSSTYLARHATRPPHSGSPAGDGSADPTGPSDTGTGTGTGTSTGPSPDDIARALPARAEWRLGGDLGRRYGAASGDRNPIHLYPLTARMFGFPRAIVHGMWSVGRCVAAHGTPPGARGAVQVRAEFRKPVLLPGTVTYAGDGDAFALRGGTDGARVHLVGTVRPTET